jgi:transposase
MIWVMKMKTHIIITEEYEAVKEAEKATTLKRVSNRLKVIMLRYEGLKDWEIGEKLGYSRKRISQLCAEFKKVGLEEYARHKYGGNHKALSDEEEELIISEFEKRAEAGQLVTVQDIKQAFDQRRGKDTGRGYIYEVLKRHGYRKIMPRSKHPNSATPEAIDASKKLTKKSKN